MNLCTHQVDQLKMEEEPAGKEASVSITENSVVDELDASIVRPRRSSRLHKVSLSVTNSCPLGNLLSIFMSITHLTLYLSNFFCF